MDDVSGYLILYARQVQGTLTGTAGHQPEKNGPFSAVHLCNALVPFCWRSTTPSSPRKQHLLHGVHYPGV